MMTRVTRCSLLDARALATRPVVVVAAVVVVARAPSGTSASGWAVCPSRRIVFCLLAPPGGDRGAWASFFSVFIYVYIM